MATPTPRRPRLAVWKFASCDGCQLSLLDCEDELLAVAGAVEIAYFLEATRATAPGPYDVSLVEGSITTAHDLRRLKTIRRRSKVLVTIGACATSGGIQALKSMADAGDYVRAVYAHPAFIRTLDTSTPIADHVPVDYELRGCPIDRGQLLHVLTALIQGRQPRLPNYAACVECKRAGVVCVMVAKGEPCLGPVTQAGCGALCPRVGRGCYGCFGPAEGMNTAALAAHLQTSRDHGGAGLDSAETRHRFHLFNANAPGFREEGQRHG
ncbi:oxidoreductase [Roseospira marina]|uniref:Oxidoreductase n=1 Tax=Roseospira marina TaxID=140057 RepID=A0A5M6IBR0_9PROT|nr:oxidoreductase [Roseospira marina]KAA5605552.1 oxidoreductase [Roseospira marina]MBB4313387.1 coenzyme F420-reducing hydrogenase gamma subunit [Roseospira marina]MBB5085872.1 coenzyme F420-reducing hydrogenase gamma subunit [Roseospira marina]